MKKIQRKPRVLWANCYCLLDTSSGASMSVRQILLQLAQTCDVKILGATNFDSFEGALGLRKKVKDANAGQFLNVNDGALTHRLLATASVNRQQMTAHEESAWWREYSQVLRQFKPDLVMFYGGVTTDLMIPDEARMLGIPSAFYLANENYKGNRWIRDIDAIITDSEATSQLYKKRNGFTPIPVGKFINSEKFIARENTRKNILFINPALAKGVGIVAMLARMLEEKAPDITIEVLQSRGSWNEALRGFGDRFDMKKPFKNVIITSHTDDMRPIYGRAKLLLAPSLWWDSGPRVLAEAMLNGIPAIVTDHAGLPEMIGEGGIKLQLPANCHEKPYSNLPSRTILEPVVNEIIAIYREPERYQKLVDAAYQAGREKHDISVSTQRLLNVFEPLLERRAGDGDFAKLEKELFKIQVV